VNRRMTYQTILLLFAALLSVFSAGLPFPIFAHEGEDHGAPQPVAVAVPGETLLAASGSGSLFEAVLKYRPFAPKETVAVTLYLVSAETNRPIADATISANLSEGDRSTAVAFTPKPGGPAGAYRPGGPAGAYSATVTAESVAPMSWLLDVTVGSESDLIGVTNFQASSLRPGQLAPVRSCPQYSCIPPRGDGASTIGDTDACWCLAAGYRFCGRPRDCAQRKRSFRVTRNLVGLLMASAFMAAAPFVRAHEGEDHSGAGLAVSAPTSPTAPLHVPIETQFLAQIGTSPARRETVSRTLRVLGRTLASWVAPSSAPNARPS